MCPLIVAADRPVVDILLSPLVKTEGCRKRLVSAGPSEAGGHRTLPGFWRRGTSDRGEYRTPETRNKHDDEQQICKTHAYDHDERLNVFVYLLKRCRNGPHSLLEGSISPE